MDGVGHPGFSELGLGDGAAADPEAMAEGRILFQLEDSGDEAGRIVWGEEETGLVVETDFGGAVEVVGEDGTADGHGLGQGARQPFAAGEVDEDVHEGDEIGDGGWRHQAGEDEIGGKLEAGDVLFETAAPGAVAHQEETGAGTAGDDGWGGGDEIVVTFEGEEAGDHADDEMIIAETEAFSEGRVRAGFEEWGEVEATEDAGELVGAADAGGEVLLGHGIRDRDEMRGGAGGDGLGDAEGGIGGSFLEWAERWAMDGVDNDGDAGAAGGEAAEETGFTAVGVDDVRAPVSQKAGEGAPGLEVEPWVDGTDEGGDESERDRESAGVGFEGAFGAGGGAGEEFEVEVVPVMEAAEGGDGIFLGAADDEPGDDMSDAHQAGGRRRGRVMGDQR
jgi:hypothetical protein